MLTERDLMGIRKRLERHLYEPNAEACADDVPALLGEIERVSQRLAEAWMTLNQIAQDAGALATQVRPHCIPLGEEIGGIGHTAARLLMDHGAPGWKRKDGA